MGDVRKTFRDTIVYGVGGLSTKLVGLVLVPMYTEYFSIELFGAMGILDVTLMAFVAIFGFQLYFGFFRYYWDKQSEGKRDSLFFTVLLSTVLLASAMCAMFYFTASSVSSILLGVEGYEHVFRLMCFSAGLQIVSIIPLKLMQLQGRASIYTIANVIMLVINMLMTLYFIIVMKKGIEAVYEAQIIGFAAFFLFMSFFIVRNIRFHFDFALLGKIIVFSYPIVLSSISTVLLTISDKYILRAFNGLGDVGIYSFAYKLAHTIPILVIQPMMLAINPMMLKKINDPDNRQFYSKMLTYLVLIVMLSIVGLSLYGKEGIHLIAQSPSYYSSFMLIPIISFAFLFSAMKDVLVVGLQISLKTKIQANIIIFASVINTVLNLLLIPLLNSYGAAFSFLITQAVYYALIVKYVNKYYPIPVETQKLVSVIVAGVAVIGVGYIVDIMIDKIIVALVMKTVLLLVFITSNYLLKVFDRSEVKSIISMFPFKRN